MKEGLSENAKLLLLTALLAKGMICILFCFFPHIRPTSELSLGFALTVHSVTNVVIIQQIESSVRMVHPS